MAIFSDTCNDIHHFNNICILEIQYATLSSHRNGYEVRGVILYSVYSAGKINLLGEIYINHLDPQIKVVLGEQSVETIC